MPQVYSDPVNDTEYYVTKFQRTFRMSPHSFAFSLSMDVEFTMTDYPLRLYGPVKFTTIEKILL